MYCDQSSMQWDLLTGDRHPYAQIMNNLLMARNTIGNANKVYFQQSYYKQVKMFFNTSTMLAHKQVKMWKVDVWCLWKPLAQVNLTSNNKIKITVSSNILLNQQMMVIAHSIFFRFYNNSGNVIVIAQLRYSCSRFIPLEVTYECAFARAINNKNVFPKLPIWRNINHFVTALIFHMLYIATHVNGKFVFFSIIR